MKYDDAVRTAKNDVLEACWCFSAGSFAPGDTTPPISGLSRKSPTMDQGVQTSGGLANNTAGGGGMARVSRGGGGYSRGHDGYIPRGSHDGYVPRGGHDGYLPRGGGQDSYQSRGDTYVRGGAGSYDGYSRGGGNVDRRSYRPQYHQSYAGARYNQQNDMRGPRPPMRG